MRRVGLARSHQHRGPQARHVLGQLGGGRLAALPERGQRRALHLGQPGAGVAGDPGVLQPLHQTRPLAGGDRVRARGLDRRRELVRHHEHRAAHASMRMRARSSYRARSTAATSGSRLRAARGEVDGRRVAGVQGDDGPRGLDGAAARRREQVAHPQPRPPLIDVAASRRDSVQRASHGPAGTRLRALAGPSGSRRHRLRRGGPPLPGRNACATWPMGRGPIGPTVHGQVADPARREGSGSGERPRG